MTEQNDVFGKLRDLGVFLIGLAAIIACIYFVFLREDPDAEMKKAMTERFLKGFAEESSPGGKPETK